MTTPTDAQVLAALEVLGWPDDRERSAHIEPDGYEVTPARHYWDHVTSVLTAADAGYVPSLLPEGMTEDELIERFRQTLAQPQRITVLPPSESDREQAAHARGVAEGRREATEGWEREWAVEMPEERHDEGRFWHCDDEDEARRFAASEPGSAVVGRLVGPWEPAEQATPSCTCPMLDVTAMGQKPGSETMKGYDPTCPVCPKPVREGEALGVTDEQRVDLHKVFGDLRDRVKGRRAQRAAERDGDDAHMAAMEERHQHEAEQDGADRGQG